MDKYRHFYKTQAWKKLRDRKFADARGLCEECLKNGIVNEGKEVHHIIPIKEDWSKRLDYDNLVLLCPQCHDKMHERDSQLQQFERLWETIK